MNRYPIVFALLAIGSIAAGGCSGVPNPDLFMDRDAVAGSSSGGPGPAPSPTVGGPGSSPAGGGQGAAADADVPVAHDAGGTSPGPAEAGNSSSDAARVATGDGDATVAPGPSRDAGRLDGSSAPDSGDTGRNDGSADASLAVFACGTRTCTLGTQTCCVAGGSRGPAMQTATCVTGTQCPAAASAALRCTQSADCDATQVCCFSESGPTPTSRCLAQCGPNERQLCDPTATGDCPGRRLACMPLNLPVTLGTCQ
ncbi:MAG: hypothetical protein JOZ69_18130 [Myxococcales bacterium]|nr:hypothetical protein [Myxococcales bacterium]